MLAKLLSGRYLLTIAAAFVFIYLAVTKLVDAKDAMSIVTMVFILYFSRSDRNQTKGGQV